MSSKNVNFIYYFLNFIKNKVQFNSNAACFKNIFDDKIWSISIQQKMKGQESLYDHVSLS